MGNAITKSCSCDFDCDTVSATIFPPVLRGAPEMVAFVPVLDSARPFLLFRLQYSVNRFGGNQLTRLDRNEQSGSLARMGRASLRRSRSSGAVLSGSAVAGRRCGAAAAAAPDIRDDMAGPAGATTARNRPARAATQRRGDAATRPARPNKLDP